MIGDVGVRAPSTAFLYVYVADVDRVFRRAIAAGARSVEEPANLAYGDRRAMVEDRWGNTWQIATPQENLRSRRGGVGRGMLPLRNASKEEDCQ